jgi:hypothetical protein
VFNAFGVNGPTGNRRTSYPGFNSQTVVGTDNSLSVLRSNKRELPVARQIKRWLKGLLSLRDPDNELSDGPPD